MKKITSILLVVVMMLAMVACSSNNESGDESKLADLAAKYPEFDFTSGKLAEIEKKGKLVLGTEAFFGPYEFHADIDGKDTIVGLDIALAQKIANELDVDLEITDMSFNILLQELNAGDVDIVIAGVSPTPERAKVVDFTNVYFKGTQSFVINKANEDTYSEYTDFDNKQVGAQIGSIQAELLEENTPNAIPVLLKTNTDIFLQLNNKQLEGAFIETIIFKTWQKNYPDLVEMCEVPYDVDGSAAAVAKGNDDFLAFCNMIIDESIENGDIDKMVDEAIELYDPQAETEEAEEVETEKVE